MAYNIARMIDTKDFGGNALRVGDLNGDGEVEYVFAQCYRPTREISCITATDQSGNVIWQWGEPSETRGDVWSDLPYQIYDWDGDGKNEVCWIEQADCSDIVIYDYTVRKRREVTMSMKEIRQMGHDCVVFGAKQYHGHSTMHILDAGTGVEKCAIPLPPKANDGFLFADLTGKGARRDFIVKNDNSLDEMHSDIYGVAADGTVLWHWVGSNGHYPAIRDLDGDGKDEVFVGYTLLDHDGTVLWQLPDFKGHSDANFIIDANGETRLLFGNGGLHCLSPAGEQLWYKPLEEGQHVIAGCFRPDLGPVQIAAINRGQVQSNGVRAPGVLYLFDWDGTEVWKEALPPGSWVATMCVIDWMGDGSQHILVSSRGKHPPAIYDGYGIITDEFSDEAFVRRMLDSAFARLHAGGVYSMSADVLGDSREEAIVFGTGYCAVFANTRPAFSPKLYNYTQYKGM